MKSIIGSADIVFITLDTLRYDIAQQAWQKGSLQTLMPYLGDEGWECRHTPGNFTFAAHQAFFAGFLPTPLAPGIHPRLYAAAFEGSESINSNTFVFSQASLPEALSAEGYRTICIGGTGFFNQRTPLSCVLTGLFEDAYWNPELGVANRNSHRNQIATAIDKIKGVSGRIFLFINVAAIHQPNWFYARECSVDCLASHEAALVAVDEALSPLFDCLKSRAPTFCIICSDHGTAYGEGGYWGHRCSHGVVWNVPYKDFML